MKTLLLSLLISYTFPSDTLHTQRAIYGTGLMNYPGTITLTDQALHFVAKSPRRQRHNLTLAYKDIIKIRRKWESIFPNRTLIQTRGGKKYTIYTYRRRKMIRIVAAHINRKK